MDTLHKAQLNTFDISVIQLQFALLNRCLCYLRPEHTDKWIQSVRTIPHPLDVVQHVFRHQVQHKGVWVVDIIQYSTLKRARVVRTTRSQPESTEFCQIQQKNNTSRPNNLSRGDYLLWSNKSNINQTKKPIPQQHHTQNTKIEIG